MRSLEDLQGRLPPGAVSTDEEVRRDRVGDWGVLALLRERRRDRGSVPDAVIFASSTEDVAAALAWATETGTPVVPRGAGSGVCGGVQAKEGWMVVDLSRMDRILEVDLESQVVHVQAGVRGDRLEQWLEPQGLTVGHYPQSISISSVGGWIAASSAGQASAGYGAIEDRLVGITAVLPDGEVVRRRPVPRSAAGPDLRRLLVGSEGILAVVTEAWLACAPRPAAWEWDAYRFGSFADCMGALREIIRAGTGAAVTRGYDEVDAAFTFGPAGHAGGCLAILGYDAGLPGLPERRSAAVRVVAAAKGEPADPGFGRHWWEHRNQAVEQYRRIMGPDRAFGSGVVVDTMEVAGLWKTLPELHARVRSALAARAEAVGCHLSHLYPTGSSLYFTFIARGADDRDVEGLYLGAWQDAAAACVEAGGTITHHHGVGRLKAPFLEAELGPGAMSVLRRIKDALDPAGVLNPGVLLP